MRKLRFREAEPWPENRSKRNALPFFFLKVLGLVHLAEFVPRGDSGSHMKQVGDLPGAAQQ